MILIGDTHEYSGYKIKSYIQKNDITDDNFIHVGDYGIGKTASERDLMELDDYLDSVGCNLYICRGNHDDPLFWNKNVEYKRIFLQPDFSVRFIEDKKILFIGGAISIDRKRRKPFNGEEFPRVHEDKVATYKNIDIVVTHTTPSFAQPINFGGIVRRFADKDPMLIQDLTNERNQITKIYHKLNDNNQIKIWFYGHFHFGNEERIDNTLFKLMKEDDFYNLNPMEWLLKS